MTLFHAPNQRHREKFEQSGGRSLIVEIVPAWMMRVEEHAGACFDATSVYPEGPLSLVGARLLIVSS